MRRISAMLNRLKAQKAGGPQPQTSRVPNPTTGVGQLPNRVPPLQMPNIPAPASQPINSIRSQPFVKQPLQMPPAQAQMPQPMPQPMPQMPPAQAQMPLPLMRVPSADGMSQQRWDELMAGRRSKDLPYGKPPSGRPSDNPYASVFMDMARQLGLESAYAQQPQQPNMYMGGGNIYGGYPGQPRVF